MINAEVARLFERIADLLELTGENRFRVNSYRQGARSVDALTEDLAALAAENRLQSVKGIGKGLAEHVHYFIEHGTIDVLDDLQKRLPPGLPKLMEIPGLGPKKVAKVHEALSVNGLDDLKKVIADGRLAQLEGFGETSVKKIAEGIAFLETSGKRTPLGIALPLAEELRDRLLSVEGVRRVEIAGSARRGEETVGDVDLLCEADNGETVVKAFTAFPQVRRVLASGATKGSVTVGLSDDRELQVDVRVVPKESFGAALQYFTGSKAHNVELRERAVKKKWKLNEYGLLDVDEKRLAGEDEAGIYRAFKLPWIPPELRQARDELSGEFDFESLVALEDIRCDLHMHTTASDGRHSIEEMAEAAKALGYHTIAICDHSKSSVIANGLTVERMKAHIKAIRKAGEKTAGIRILAGCECDILPDGSLDYPDELLAECDWVVASIHIAQGKGGSGKLSPTQRTLAAIENPFVSCIGHPTGRLINRREPMDLDMAAIVKAAADSHTMLEINAAWQRLDLKSDHARQAIAAGVMLSVNTDAHSTGDLRQMRYGVVTARRAAARKSDILNALTPAALLNRIRTKRKVSS
ncbi:MAG: DNA polymerase/3'-5' exonuclease PolX [Phycisphaerales bacterium]|nr:DNA polymerase/3'-5' exonuclease PolX [Phycisphaerales bacterium]